MRYRALGPLTVEIEGHAVKLGGLRQQMVLAVLLSAANRVVPQDRLIDLVWAGSPPEAARATVQSYIYGLRQVLGSEAILRRGDGYIIEVDADTFDVFAFEESLNRGRRLLESDPSAARAALVEGLNAWFGTAYGGVDHPELHAEIQRLAELRVNAIESRIDADLALGRDGELVSELETLVRDYPLRERFWAQLMLALYRSGRQAEALRAFQQARNRLVEDLGIEPGFELQRLEERILHQDSSLLISRAPVESAFLFTDVEGSTVLWEVDPERAPVVLDAQDRVVTEAVTESGGSVFKRTGDGVYAVFEDVDQALFAAARAQHALTDADWGDSDPVRVRMAVGCGVADWSDGEYSGAALHRLARVLATGHGGQVLVTDEAVGSAADETPLRNLGEFRLRGLGTPETIHQLDVPGLEAEFPPLRLDRPAAAVGAVSDVRAIRGYELRQPVGEGDFGVVYRAFQPSVGREVAVKAIRAEYANNLAFVKRFEREAQIVANLEHPHIVPLFDYWRDPDGAYLVMPLMRGGSLAEALRRGGWNLEPALRLLDQVGSALAYAHRRGVLHRDLKPGNVILDEDGNAYLSDFGIAARLSDAADVPVTSSQGFIPPEELAGDQHTVRSDVFGLGALTFHLLTGVAPSATLPLPDLVEARPGTPAELAAVVARATAVEPAERFGRVEDFLRDLRRAAGVDVIAASDLTTTPDEPARNPYKGLRAFGEEDAIDFHGRAAFVDDLLENVASHRLVTVVGPSGSGKSSVVRAGLIPALRAGGIPGSREWLITDMFPGSYPFEELEAALSRVAVDRPAGLLTELTEPHGLLRVSKQILPGDDATLLLVIDQFEELFSTVPSEDTRRRFLENLIAVANDERSRVRVVMTTRADFLDRPLGYGDFADAIADGVMTVGPPTREGLAQAMAAPARTVGLDLEPGLVGRITSDVLGQPGALPLLQYALTEMFSRREGATLTITGYEETGGVTGALGRRAEELYEGLGPTGEEAARQVFLRLVSVDELAADTRRRARQSELLSLNVDRSGVESVLSAYAGFRLLTFDRDPVTRGPTVEVAHEALFTEWERLRGWIDDARDSLILARRVRESAQEWIESDRDPSYLLRGARLDEVEKWTSDPEVVLTVGEAEFIEASIDNREEERAAARRRRRRTIMALAAGLAVVSVLAVVAFVQRGVAEREALQARVRELAVASGSHFEENQELALLIAAEAFDQSIEGLGEPLPEASSALAQAIQDWRLIGRFPAGEERIAEGSPDGSLVVTSVGEHPSPVVHVFDANGEQVSTLEDSDHPGVLARQAMFHPDGEKIAVSYTTIDDDGIYQSAPEGVSDVVVFDAVSGSVLSRIDVGDDAALWLSFGPSGEMLAVSSRQDVRVVDWQQGMEIVSLAESSNIGRANFLDEETLLVPIDRSGLALYSLVDGSLIEHRGDPELTSLSTAADSTRTRLAYVAGDRIRVMDIATGEVVFDQEAPGVVALALNPHGTRLAYAGFDPNIYVVPVDGEAVGMELAGSFGNVAALSFVGPDRLLSHGGDALMWDVSQGATESLDGIAVSGPLFKYEISPDQNWLSYTLSANSVSTAGHPADGFHLLELEAAEEILVQEGELVNTFAGVRMVSPDFTMVGSLSSDGRSTVRRLPSWDVVREFAECRNPLAFTPDNSRILLTGWVCGDGDPPDGAATESEVIDLESGEPVVTLPKRTYFSAEFNPDGVFEGGRYLVASDRLSVEVWDLRTGESVGRLERSELNPDQSNLNAVRFLMSVNFDPSGRYVVGGTTGGAVWTLDMERLIAGVDIVDALLFREQAHTGAAPVPDLNADGLVATAGFDGVVRLWDLQSGDLLMEFETEMTTPVVHFTPDGSHLLYPHGPSIRRIPVDPYELRALAGDLLTRDMLPDECARYARPERCASLDSGAGG